MIKFAALIACLVCAPVSAQEVFPSRPLRIFVGTAAGGNGDTAARLIAPALAKLLGQPVIVEPRLGAGGMIATEAAGKATPDGHTLALITGGHSTQGAMVRKLPIDWIDGLAWVSTLVLFPFTFTVRADSPIRSLEALIDAARAKPDSVTYGSSGTGATLHLTGELLARMAGVRMVHVPYKGESQSLAALLAGDITMSVATPTVAIGQRRSGKIRVLAVSSNTRHAQLPDVPTVAEAGIAGFDVRSWLGVATTGGTPRAIVGRLNDAVRRTLEAPDVHERFIAFGGEVTPSTPEAMRARVASEIALWTKLIDEAGIPRE